MPGSGKAGFGTLAIICAYILMFSYNNFTYYMEIKQVSNILFSEMADGRNYHEAYFRRV